MSIVYINGIPEELNGGIAKCSGMNIHREDGPAVIYDSGTKEWWINGKRHRTDGPAIEYRSGFKSWYLKGRKHSYEEFLRRLSKEDAVLVALTWE
jgi:hypothetical protein